MEIKETSMARHTRSLAISGGVMVMVGAALLAFTLGTAGPSAGEGRRQGPLVPTATYFPVAADFTFDLQRVEMTDDPITFPDETLDGFAITHFTYVTRYPLGLEFAATITPPEGVEVLSVNLMYRFPANSGGRVRAEATGNPNEWRAVAFDTRGLAPWMPLRVFWRISYSDLSLETTPVDVIYIDHTRPWWRAESEDVIAYWFDFPEELGRVVTESFVKVRDRFIQGFGGLLPFKPIVVIYPPGEAMGEWQSGGQINPRTTGLAQNDTYAAVLRVRGLEIEEIRKACIWNEARDLNWQMRFAASVATHEVAHLYQFYYGVRAPAWWIEGQATFFELELGPVDERLKALAARGIDLATLQFGGPSGEVGTAGPDGCTHLGYDMGASFINWLVYSHGGFEAHRQIVELIDQNVVLEQAVERVTGVPFAELERQWRTYIGLNPEPVIIPTSPYIFPPTITPPGQ